MTRRFAVLSTGHAGSTWACASLNALGYHTVHEPLTYLVAPDVRARLAASPETAHPEHAFDRWRAWTERSLEDEPFLGEVHTGAPMLWVAARTVLPEHRVLLMRHPVQVVHSVSRADRARVLPVLRSAGLVGPTEDPTDAEVFSHVCRIWASQTDVVDALGGLPVFRLSEITADSVRFADFVEALVGERPSEERAVALASRVVNRKAEGRRPPEQIYWSWWSEAERERFGALCGEAMRRFGYAIPARPLAAATEPSSTVERGCIADWLLPAWELHRLRRSGPVVVVGEGRRAIEAAREFGGRGAWLLRSASRPWQRVPAGARVAAIDALPNDVAGVFSVDVPEDDPDLRACRARFPAALWVPSFPHHGGDLPPDDGDLVDASNEAPSSPPDAAETALGVRRGDSLGGWDVVAVRVRSDACVFQLRQGAQGCDAVISSTGGPVAVGDLWVTYERATAEFADLRPALEALAAAVERWAAGRSVAGAVLHGGSASEE